MRQTISGLIAAAALMAASAAPAMACGWGFPCGPAYVPAVPVYSGCGVCGGWGFDRLADPAVEYGRYSTVPPQYYYVNQGPTYTGPGAFAPYPTYQEGVPGWAGYGYSPYPYGYGDSASPYYGGAVHVSGPVVYRYHGHAWHAQHGYGHWRHGIRYGYHGAPHRYSYRYHTMHRHY
jgi:hypothetical protein